MNDPQYQDHEGRKAVFGALQAPGFDSDGPQGAGEDAEESIDLAGLVAELRNLAAARVAEFAARGAEVAAIIKWERVAHSAAQGVGLLVCARCFLIDFYLLEGAGSDGVTREDLLLGMAGQSEKPTEIHVFTTEVCPFCSPDVQEPQIRIVFRPRH
jgi:hypothetical protein